MKSLRHALALAAASALFVVPSGQVAASAEAPATGSCRTITETLVRDLVNQHIASLPPPTPPAPTPDVDAEDEAATSWFDRFSVRSASEAPSAPTTSAAPPMAEPDAAPPADRPARQARRSSPPRPAGVRAEKSKADSADKGRGPTAVSKTNTQEAEVDEGDIVKTDGRFVYHLSSKQRGAYGGVRNELRIYASWPIRSARLLARFPLPADVAPNGVEQMYLFDDHVAVIGRAYNGFGARAPYEMQGVNVARITPMETNLTRVLVLDVRDKARPQIVRHVDVEGSVVDTRMIGQRLYLAATTMGIRLPHAMLGDIYQTVRASQDRDVETIVAALDERWNLASLEIGLPRFREVSKQRASEPLYSCDDLVYDTTDRTGQVLSLAHIDLADRGPIEGAGMNGYSATARVYASEGAFYVANPISAVQFPGHAESVVKKFELGRAGKPRFVAKGHVRGHLLNQFSMSEYGGYLRVATNDNWQQSEIHVLQTEGDRLAPVGHVGGIAPGERIYAVRMMGARGYVVTFRRTDPLYTLDLSNPRAPRVVGELKVEGWSSYLHPLDETHLLTVGQDADFRGRATGFHLQIFDVTDPANPRRTHHEKLSAGSISSAEGDHHAFMFEPTTKTLAIPWKGSNYWGLVAYQVDANRGFRSLGRVNHALMYKQFYRQNCRGSESPECGRKNYWWKFFTAQDLDIDRVVAIDGNLFSLSRSGLMVHRVGRGLSQRRAVLVTEPEWRPNEPAMLGAAW